jgi:predicted O-methyltransferase YrrM
MPPDNPALRSLHTLASRVPGLLPAYRRIRDYLKKDPLPAAIYRNLFERGRLRLPVVNAEELCPASGGIWLPACYPFFAPEDAPLNDMLFLLNLARGRQARRILEVGTYRARTALALHLNCPEAVLVSYDIQVLDSEFRRQLAGKPNVQLRHASFAGSAESLRQEPFDFIFVDGSHHYEDVLGDSRLALEVLAPGGIVVWHDYRYNDRFAKELRVPEALEVVRQSVPVFAVRGTMCAVHVNGENSGRTSVP